MQLGSLQGIEHLVHTVKAHMDLKEPVQLELQLRAKKFDENIE